jgi:hypothetical protein
MGALTKFNDFSNSIQGAFGALLIVICIAGIFGLALLMILKIPHKSIAVILQTIGCCILMMPVMFGLNNYVSSKAGKIEQTLNERNKIREQERKIIELENTIRQIESTGFNLQQFQKILELGLIEATLKQTVLSKTIFDNTHRSIFPGGYFDWEYLGVMTNNITAKFGVDLKLVRLWNSNEKEKTIMVSGISSKFIGTSEYSTTQDVSEVRKINLNGKNEVIDVQIDNSRSAKDVLLEYERKMQNSYQERLNKGLETDFMNETVEKLAENFIKMILAPLQKEIVFTHAINTDSLDLSEFIEREMADRTIELKKLKNE